LKFDAGKSEYLQLDTIAADENRDSVVSDWVEEIPQGV
jgi:hypothetical protein